MSGFPFERTKALAEKATPGPWEAATILGQIAIVNHETKFMVAAFHPDDTETPGPENAEFIADARSAVPALVAAVERVQALHTPVCGPRDVPCAKQDCRWRRCKHCGNTYPCATLEALETP